MKKISLLLAMLVIGCTITSAATPGKTIALVIHGGAGTMPRAAMTAESEAHYREGLGTALDAGYAVLDKGGTALDAVSTVVRLLEDNPLFNAGKGAVLTHDGYAELDASIMDGRELRAGAVTGLRHIQHPIDLARAVMEKSPHLSTVEGKFCLFGESGKCWASRQKADRKSYTFPPFPISDLLRKFPE